MSGVVKFVASMMAVAMLGSAIVVTLFWDALNGRPLVAPLIPAAFIGWLIAYVTISNALLRRWSDR